MNDAELYTLIQSDPDAKAKADTGDDSACAVRCSEIAPTIRQPVDAGRLMDAMIGLGVWRRLVAAALPNATDPPASTAQMMMTRIQQNRAIDFDNAAVQTIVADCITYNLMTQTEAQQMNTLGDAHQTITAADVGAAREWHRVTGGSSHGVT
jgi:hypothetical protein